MREREREREQKTLKGLDRRLQKNFKMECRAAQNRQGIIEQNSTCRKDTRESQTWECTRQNITILWFPSQSISVSRWTPEAETPHRTLPWKSHWKRSQTCSCSLRRSDMVPRLEKGLTVRLPQSRAEQGKATAKRQQSDSKATATWIATILLDPLGGSHYSGGWAPQQFARNCQWHCRCRSLRSQRITMQHLQSQDSASTSAARECLQIGS